MALIFRVEITDDKTGEVKQTFVEACPCRDSWDEAKQLRRLLDRAFTIAYGQNNDEWA